MLFRSMNDSKKIDNEPNLSQNVAKSATKPVKEYNEAWAEFSVPQTMGHELTNAFNEIKVIADSLNIPIKIEEQFHLTLIYGYTKSDSKKLMDIVRKYKGEAFTVEFDRIHYGYVAKDQIMAKIIPHKELQDLFLEIFHNVPNQHTLIDGGYYPHVTIGKIVADDKFFNSDSVKNFLSTNKLSLDELEKQIKDRKFSFDQILSLSEVKNRLKGKQLTIDHIISYRDDEGPNIKMDEHAVGQQHIPSLKPSFS